MTTMIKLKNILTLGLTLILASCGDNNTKTVDDQNSTSQTSNSAPTTTAKVDIFNNVAEVKNILSQNGIGELRKWWTDGYGWMSSTDYYSFGSPSAKNNTQNNLAYYLESENENNLETVKLILNIFNGQEKNEAILKFKSVTVKTFESLKLPPPNGLIEAIKKPKEFQSDNENFSVVLKCDKSNIDTWKLTIQTK